MHFGVLSLFLQGMGKAILEDSRDGWGSDTIPRTVTAVTLNHSHSILYPHTFRVPKIHVTAWSHPGDVSECMALA